MALVFVFVHYLGRRNDITVKVHFRVIHSPESDSVYSDYIYQAEGRLLKKNIMDVIWQFETDEVSFIPAEIIDIDGNIILDYTYIKTTNVYEAMDKEKSEFEYNMDGGVAGDQIWQLYLDETVLRNIPLKNRLIFILKESGEMYFHSSIIDAIEAKYPDPDLLIVDGEEYNG